MSQTAHMRDPRKTVYVPGLFGAPKELEAAYAARYQAIKTARYVRRITEWGYGYNVHTGSVELEDVRDLELDERDIALLIVSELNPGGASVWLDRQTGEFYVRESIID